MKLGYAFEIAITVQDLGRSLQFYKKLGYQPLNDPSLPASDALLNSAHLESSMREAPYNIASVETVAFRKEDGN